MVNLPHRFVPTTSKFVSPVRIVSQYGHGAGITAVSFSPCTKYFASADEEGWLRIWSLETLDVLGIYLLGFRCEDIGWDGINAVVCRCRGHERRIVFSDESKEISSTEMPLGNVIRLLDAPEVMRDGDSVIIHYGDNEFVHAIPGLLRCELEPCERYVVALSTNKVQVFSAFEDEELLEMISPEGHHWCNLHISWRGDFFLAISDDGGIWIGDAIKKTSSCLLRGNTELTASGFGGEKYAIYGDNRGNITVFDIEQRTLLLRTPRRPVDFNAVYPASDKVGFVALRSESATAFFSQSREILSASPLPAPVRASCPGMQFSELIVACTDNILYRIKLDDNSISKVCRVNREIDAIACNNDAIFMHFVDGSSASFENNVLSEHPWISKRCPISLALSDNSKTVVALFADHLDIIERSGKKETRRVDIKGAVQLICGKEKSANQILVMMADLRIVNVDMRTGDCSELNRLDIEYGRVVSVAPAAKSFTYVLVEAEHGQFVILKLGLNTGKSSIVLRVMSVGTQIFGASSSDDAVCLRNDATCLRIISGLKAFSIDDWSRSEPLQLF